MKRYTLSTAFEEIALELRDSSLADVSFSNVHAPKRYINRKLGTSLTNSQIFILAAMMNVVGEVMKISQIAEFGGISKIRILGMQSDFDELERMGLIECVKCPTRSSWDGCYAVSYDLVSSVRENGGFKKGSYLDLSHDEVYHLIAEWMEAVDNDKMEYKTLCHKLRVVVEDCKSVQPYKFISELNLSDAELVVLLKCITSVIINDDNQIYYYQYDDIIASAERRVFIRSLKTKETDLLTKSILTAEFDSNEDLQPTLSVTEEFQRDYLDLQDEAFDSPCDSEEAHENEYPVKAMFYNAEERLQISNLTRLLSQDGFTTVQERLSAVGMRTGFATLFYGAPGTGKTETVYQLANATGREVVAVNLSTIKGMFVGESERNIQQIFDDYNEKVEECEVCPILFFNEADGIFGKRLTDITTPTGQMENTVQNIILQNMETFSGILIATTNLAGNLDKAFERRFLYKIEFHKPDASVRFMIWKSLIPELTDSEVLALAKEYPFSGGEIENIARKQLIESVIQGQPSTLELIRGLCEHEKINAKFNKSLFAGQRKLP